MARKRYNERDVIDVLAWQGIVVPCFRCGEPLVHIAAFGPALFYPKGKAEREHIHELGLGGPDLPHNCRYSHAECHAIVTNGTPATTAGSSKHRIAKTKGSRASKFAVRKLSIDKERPQKPRWGSSLRRRA